MRATEVLKSAGAHTIDSDTFTLEHKVEGGVRTEDRIYTDSVFQYITAASSIRNSTIAQIKSTSTTDSTPKNFFFVRRNGLGPLRVGSEKEAENFYNFYLDTADDYNTKFRIIMIVAIVLLIICDTILIPIVFSVHRTNDRVLAFFGWIPISEISELAAKCERYMQLYIEDHKEHKEYSLEASEEEIEHSHRTQNVDNSYLDSQNQEAVEGDSINPETSMQLDVSERIEVPPVNNFQTPGGQAATLNIPASSKRLGTAGNAGKSSIGSPNETSALKVSQAHSMQNSKAPLNKSGMGMSNMSARPEDARKTTLREEERRKEEEALDLEQANDRSQKLLNSRNNRRSSVVIQFVIIAALFGIYFLLDYLIVELNFLDDVKSTLAHLKLTSERMPIIRYLNAFALEEISEGNKTNVYYYSECK